MHISHTHKDGKAEVVAQFHIWAVEEGIRKIKSYIRFCLKERKRERRVEGGGRGREGEGEGEAGGGGGKKPNRNEGVARNGSLWPRHDDPKFEANLD